jgi:N-acetylglucosamine kinase-like BadF-type ATPase
MEYVLAIDVGGTKCEALVVDLTGKVIGRGRCDPGSHESGRGFFGCGRAPETIAAAARQALAPLREKQARVTLCGPAVAAAMQALHVINGVSFSAGQTFGEEAPALVFTGETDAVVALSGTGAFVWGKSREGRELRIDALGPVLGDFGSACDIGSRALRLAVRASWDRRINSSLSSEILAACGASAGLSSGELVWQNLTGLFGDRSELAALASIVDREARGGDLSARQILQAAADDLAENCQALIDRLEIADGRHAFIGTGSVIVRSDVFWDRLCQRVLAMAPGFRPMRSTQPPAAGFALLQLQELSSEDPDRLKERVLDSYADLTPFVPPRC